MNMLHLLQFMAIHCYFVQPVGLTNANVARRAYDISPKIVRVVEYWINICKYKQHGRGYSKANKSYQVLLDNYGMPWFLFVFCF